MYDTNGLGIRIAQFRKDKQMTQKSFAEKLGVSAQAVSKWETGLGYPDITLLPKIAEELDITVEQLFGKEIINTNTEEIFDFPEEKNSLKLVGQLGAVACYASTEGKQVDNKVLFADGSSVDLETRTIFNEGNNNIILAYADEAAYVLTSDHAEYQDDDTIDSNLDFDSSDQDSKSIKNYDIEIKGNANIKIVPRRAENKQKWHASGSMQFMKNLKIWENKQTLFVDSGNYKQSVFSFSNKEKHNQITLYAPSQKMNSLNVNIKGAGDIVSEVDFVTSTVKTSGSGDTKLQESGITDISINGSGNFSSTKAQDVKVRIAGSGDANIVEVSGSAICKTSGSGSIKLQNGYLEQLNISVAGTGDLDAAGVTVKDLDVSVFGVGDIVIGAVIGKSKERISKMASLKILNR